MRKKRQLRPTPKRARLSPPARATAHPENSGDTAPDQPAVRQMPPVGARLGCEFLNHPGVAPTFSAVGALSRLPYRS